MDLGQLPPCEPFFQGKKLVLSHLRPVIGLQGGRGGAQEHAGPVEPGHLYGSLSGMVFGRGFAFVTALVLLVDDDEPHFWKRREQRRARAYDHVYLSVPGPLALVIFFPGGKIGVQDADPVPEPGIEAQQGLIGQRNLGNQHDCLSAPAHNL